MVQRTELKKVSVIGTKNCTHRVLSQLPFEIHLDNDEHHVMIPLKLKDIRLDFFPILKGLVRLR